jgi:hypothetical protein
MSLMKRMMNPFGDCGSNAKAIRAIEEVTLALQATELQYTTTVREQLDARMRLRTAHATGALPHVLNTGILEVEAAGRKLTSKSKVISNLKERLHQLEDVDANAKVISAMRATNGALKSAYCGSRDTEDEALDLVEEFGDYAESNQLIMEAMGTEIITSEGNMEEEGVDQESLARALGGQLDLAADGIILPSIPNSARNRTTLASDTDSTNSIRSEIRALRL